MATLPSAEPGDPGDDAQRTVGAGRALAVADANERALEKQIVKAARCDREARRLMEAPSVGPIIASMVLAKVSDAKRVPLQP